jgi:prepilin-type processing-associated H-X9-DG protein
MNAAVGTMYNTVGSPPTAGLTKGSPVVAGWLDGAWNGASRSKYWLEFGKLGSMIRPVPSNLFVIAEENPCSINDPAFAMQMGPPDANSTPTSMNFGNVPGSYHNGGVTISFADGHSEIHKWLGAAVKITAYPPGGVFVSPNDPLSLQDLRWLQARTTARGVNQPPIHR